MASRIIVVRHGATQWSEAGRHTGRTDVALLEEGRDAARRLAPRFAECSPALVLISPLRRAAETARLAGLDGPGRHAELDDDLMEWDYGEVEGVTTAERRSTHPGWLVWNDGCPGGETVEQVGKRTDRVLARCAGIDGEVVLVAHGHVLRILTARWLGLPAIDGRLFALDPTSPSTLGYEQETHVIERWNAS